MSSHPQQDVAQVYDKHSQRMTHVHTGSSSNGWKWLLGEVQKVHPALLESYEAAWPVVFIVKEHRRRKVVDRRPSRQGPRLGLAFWTKHMIGKRVNNPSPVVRERNAAPNSVQPRTRAARSKPSPSQAPSASRSRSVVDSAISTRTRSSIARRHDRATPTGTSLNIQPTRTIIAGGKCEIDEPKPTGPPKSGSVLDFLKSLNPSQSALLPVFMNMGVTNADDLRQLAVMPGWLHGWIKEDLITEFQFALLRVGLRKLLDA